jgi:hypothetical protein
MSGNSRATRESGWLRGDVGFWGILVVAAALWIFGSAILAPRAGGTDVYIFKDAGCNLALGQGFVSEALPGSLDLAPHLYASYAPGVALLFGIVARVFGCSAYTDTFFDLIVGLLVSLAVARVLVPAIAPRFRLPCALLLGLSMPVGFVAAAGDRPEASGMLGFVLVCVLARGGRRPFAAAFAAGTVTLFYPFGGMLSGFAAWCIALGPCSSRDIAQRWRPALGAAVRMLAVYLVPILLVAAAYDIVDPTSFARFGGHAFGAASGAGAVFDNSYAHLLAHAAFSSGPYSLSLTLSSAVAAVLVIGIVRTDLPGMGARTDWILPVLLLAFIAAPFLFPGQNNYMAWSRSALAVLLATAGGPIASAAVRRHIVPLLLVIVCLANLPFIALDAVIRAQSRESYNIAETEARSYAQALSARRANRTVLVPAAIYFIYKPLLHRIANPDYFVSLKSILPEIGGVVACPFAKVPGTKDTLDSSPAPRLELISRVSSHVMPELFGRRLTHREWGFSCDQYVVR